MGQAPVLVMCDNDGTLVQSEKAHFNAISGVAVKHSGHMITDDEWWEHCSGKGHARIWQWLHQQHPGFAIEQNNFIQECLAAYERGLPNLQARKGMKSSLNHFGLGTSILPPVNSNTVTNTVYNGLIITGLRDVLGDLYGADIIKEYGLPTKPAPDSWLYIAKQRHDIRDKDLKRVAVFEDSDSGCLSARIAGLYVVQFTHHEGFGEHGYKAPKSPHANYYIGKDPEELAKFTHDMLNGDLLP